MPFRRIAETDEQFARSQARRARKKWAKTTQRAHTEYARMLARAKWAKYYARKEQQAQAVTA